MAGDFRTLKGEARKLSGYVESGLIHVAAEVLAEDKGVQTAEVWAGRKAYAVLVARGLTDDRLVSAAYVIVVTTNQYDTDNKLKNACRNQWNVLAGVPTGSAT